jgi:hypothetical protein
VRFVESVAGEVFDLLEDLFGGLTRNPVLLGAVGELLLELGEDFRLLLAHRLAERIGFVQREPGKHVRDAHDLFLVQDAAKRSFRIGSRSACL